ncbi:MAG: hypothetical protein K2N32_01960, partial [Clostridia bacterium]|nr:hypothetical protein [Clostridia bacterium]
YTMDAVDGSLTSFIDAPSAVEWQENEVAIDNNFEANGSKYSNNFNNDAYSDKSVGNMVSGKDYTVPPSGTTDRAISYTAWKDDKIWLPSMTETGWSQKSSRDCRGLWRTSTAQRGNDKGSDSSSLAAWTRSAGETTYSNCCVLNYDGSASTNHAVNSERYFRPAFHLNLKKAEEASVDSLPVPKDIELEYTGDEQGVESKYDQDFLDRVDIKYYDEGSTTPRSTKPTTVGNYTVKYTLKDGYYWADNLDGAERTKSFKINPLMMDFPTFDNSKYSIQKSYAGDEEISFTLDNFDKKYIEVTYSGADSGVSYDGTYSEALAKYVGKYYLDVKIKDEYGSNCVFKDTPTSGKLEFEVVKATVGMEILDGSSSSIVGIRGSKKKVTLNIPDAQKKVHPGKRIYVQVVAKDEFEEYVLSGNVEIDGSKLQYSERELNIGRLRKGTYDLEIKVVDGLDGASYTASVVNGAKLEVKEVEPGTQLIWQLYSGRDTDGSFVAANIGDYESEYDSFAYDGKEYHFEVTPPNGYTVESIKTENKAGESVSVGKNADTYTTTIELKETSSGEITEYSITWTIDKAKFDLSNVKWKYDGKIPFSTNALEMVAKIDESTLPKGLLVERYAGVTTGSSVGDGDKASVTFKLDTSDPSYEQNYELPTVGGKGSNYTYSGSGDFSWEINWKIEKLVIKLEWETENYEGKYERWKLKEDKNVVDYEYYLWDTANKTIVGEALSESEIEIEENVTKYYVTKAVIKDRYKDDVEFSGTKVISDPFAVGEIATGVGVTLTSSELTYSGSAQPVKLRIDGGLSESDFEIAYYDKNGTTELAEVPVNVGKYRVEIKIKESVSGYYLTGENVVDGVAIIEYEIKQMEIK